jgi:hypothetical protein
MIWPHVTTCDLISMQQMRYYLLTRRVLDCTRVTMMDDERECVCRVDGRVWFMRYVYHQHRVWMPCWATTMKRSANQFGLYWMHVCDALFRPALSQSTPLASVAHTHHV